MKIEDEPDIFFIGEDGVEIGYNVKETLILFGKEQCSDEVYDQRKAICDSCEHLRKGELCDVDRNLIRLENRIQDKTCPINKW